MAKCLSERKEAYPQQCVKRAGKEERRMETEKWKNWTWLIKQIPKPQHEPLENPEFQQHAREEMRRTQKKIEHIQQQKNISISLHDFYRVCKRRIY